MATTHYTNGVHSNGHIEISAAPVTGTVSHILSEQGIRTRPGTKGECPKCNHDTFSIKADDTFGMCFHPSCGHIITPGSNDRKRGSVISRVLEALYRDSHHELLELRHGQHNAYTYLHDERGIHADVIALAMI